LGSSADDRRTSERVEALVLVQLGDDERYGVTRDVSERGLLIATRSSFSPGDRIEIVILDPGGPIRTTARVVRVVETPPEEAWRYRVALELDGAIPPEIVAKGAEAAATLLRQSKPPSKPPSSANG
jgi:hypothetical protein